MALINSVTPGEEYKVAVELSGGNIVFVNLSKKLNTCRFRNLVSKEKFYNVSTDGIFVIWNNGEIKLSTSEVYELKDPENRFN